MRNAHYVSGERIYIYIYKQIYIYECPFSSQDGNFRIWLYSTWSLATIASDVEAAVGHNVDNVGVDG